MEHATFNRDPLRELSGEWEFAVDPDDVGRDDAWYESDVDWPESRTVSVPHSWQEHDDLREYTGAAWYRRTVNVDAPADDERAVLYFGAADYETTVWVNGERVGVNREGYLPFRFDVTEHLVDGENAVAVRVFDPEDMSEIPHGKQGDPWYTRVSGLWQRVDLAAVPATRVRDARATPELDADAARFDIRATAADGVDPSSLSATVRVLDDGTEVASGASDLDVNGRGTVVVDLDDPDYWTPEMPSLYDFEVELERDGASLDVYADYFGMRSVEHDGDRLLLNGDPLSVRGALDQAYYPDTFYRPSDLDLFETEIRTAKELGFNMLRKHIKPAHPRFLELADRLGMLVWEEPANPSVYTDASREAVQEQFSGMVERDFNRPSVIVWSLYNEEWGIGGHYEESESLWTDEEKQEFLAGFYHSAREEDPTRLICDNSGWAHVATDLNDYHEYFVVPDRADAWREKLDYIVEHPEENYGVTETDPESVPLLMSEFGTWGLSSVPALEEHYGGDPHWFHHDFLSGLKSPAGVRDRFEGSHLSETFDDLDDLAAAWQRRELQSVAEIIADMRVHDGVAGYVITEFTDIEWEFNGILDYLREEKSLHEDFARINAPVAVRVEPSAHVCWDDEALNADLVVVNDTGERIEETIRWEAFGESGDAPIEVEPFGVERLSDAVSVSIPNVDGVKTGAITATLDDRDLSGEATITAVSRSVGAGSDLAVYADDSDLREALAGGGAAVSDSPSEADVALVTELDESTRTFVEDGGKAVLLPDADGHVDESDAFSFAELPEKESWNLCASFVSQTLLPEVDVVPGWAFDDLYPYAYVSDPEPEDDVLVGYTEGWLANSGGIVLSRAVGDGQLAACTLRVTDGYGSHPTATAALAAVIDEL